MGRAAGSRRGDRRTATRGGARNQSDRHRGLVRPRSERTSDRRSVAPLPARIGDRNEGGFDRPGPGKWKENGRPAHLRAACEGSLHRLKLERIDLYQLHRIDPAVPMEDQIATLKRLQEEGKIRHIGLSEVGVSDIERVRRLVPIVSVQNRYNLVDRQYEPVLDYCAREGMAFLPWFPLATGTLARAGGPLARVAERLGATPAQVALAWLLRRSPVMLPIPGTASVQHLEENAGAALLELGEREYEQIANSRGA